VRILRFDGLVGWCAVSYLTDLGTTAPEKVTQKIFNGVTYFRQEMQSPRKMVAHVLSIDMRVSGLKSLVTPPSHESGLVCTRTTSKFLEEFGLQVAINGDGFSYLDQDTYPPHSTARTAANRSTSTVMRPPAGTVYSQRGRQDRSCTSTKTTKFPSINPAARFSTRFPGTGCWWRKANGSKTWRARLWSRAPRWGSTRTDAGCSWW
jgi:hypothetical protein